MDINQFIVSPEYIEFKKFLTNEFIDKPFDLKTNGKSDSVIASEARASEYACLKLKKALLKFERKIKVMTVKSGSFK